MQSSSNPHKELLTQAHMYIIANKELKPIHRDGIKVNMLIQKWNEMTHSVPTGIE